MTNLLTTINQEGGKASFNMLSWANNLPVDIYTLSGLQWNMFVNHPSVRRDFVVVHDISIGAKNKDSPINLDLFDKVFSRVNCERGIIKFKNGTIFERELQ